MLFAAVIIHLINIFLQVCDSLGIYVLMNWRAGRNFILPKAGEAIGKGNGTA